MANLNFSQLSQNEMADMRRELMRIVKSLDDRNNTTEFSLANSIFWLYKNKKVPRLIMQYMHLIRVARNVSEYDDWLPDKNEAILIRLTWQLIQEWYQKSLTESILAVTELESLNLQTLADS